MSNPPNANRPHRRRGSYASYPNPPRVPRAFPLPNEFPTVLEPSSSPPNNYVGSVLTVPPLLAQPISPVTSVHAAPPAPFQPTNLVVSVPTPPPLSTQPANPVTRAHAAPPLPTQPTNPVASVPTPPLSTQPASPVTRAHAAPPLPTQPTNPVTSTLAAPPRHKQLGLRLFIHTGNGAASKEFTVHLNPIRTDKQLFTEFRHAYNTELRSFWQRFFSLRGLNYIGLLEYSTQPRLILLPTLESNSLLFAFRHPQRLSPGNKWVKWARELKNRPPHRYGLEFVQGWDVRKIFMLGAIPWVGSVFTAVVWAF